MSGDAVDRSEAADPPEAADQPEVLEEGINHYYEIDEVPKATQKYFHQRYGIFSKYDDGILMTDDAWFGVTPEPIANKLAQQIAEAAPKDKKVLIDAFAGAGGNTIAFALSGRWEQIFAFEKDPKTLKCAKRNAEIYGVDRKIWWIEGDSLELIPQRFAHSGNEAVIFASPPWGGQGYRDDKVFSLATMQPYGLKQLYETFTKATEEVALYLPRTSDLNQLAKYAPDDGQIQAAHYCMHGASKALCAFYGKFGPIV